ncbi:hypothetical protein GCM10027174_27260 [Salinifilum aidingensis]
MLLDGTGGWLRTWQESERYAGGGTRDYSRFAADMDIAAAYHPQRGAESFTVPTFRIAPERGRFLRGALASPVVEHYRCGDGFVLPVHPETLTVPDLLGREELLACPRGLDLEVVPSANARTVFVESIGGEPVEPHFVKLHYPKRLSRFTRRLRRPIIRLQLWAAAELVAVDVPLVAEVAGGVFGHDERDAWGFLVREARPRLPGGGVGCAPEYVLPLLALYGRDVRSPGDPPLLRQLVDRSGEDPGEWLAHRVVAPVVRLWVETLRRTGCVMEPHGQNTLLATTADGRDTRVLYRDSDVYVDPVIRRGRGLTGSLPPVNVISRDLHRPREHVFSLTYDSFMGHHTLDRLARCVEEVYGVPPRRLQRVAREVFVEQAGAALPLPGSVHYYDDQLHPDGGWRLVDTGELPRWRSVRGA